MSETRKQQRFFALLEQKAPQLLPLWDRDEQLYRPDAVEQYLEVASTGEKILARFFLGVWLNSNDFDFDIFYAVKKLDNNTMKIITDWLDAPEYP